MMMDGRHLEQPLGGAGQLAGELEVIALEDDAHAGHDHGEADQQQQEGLTQQHRHAHHRAADEHGAGIAHEHRCRVVVEAQEADARAAQGQGKQGDGRVHGGRCHQQRNRRPANASHRRHGGQDAVQAVLEIGGVHHEQHRQRQQRDVEDAQIPLHIEEGHDDLAAHLRVEVAVAGKADAHDRLADDLLPGGEALVALFDHLDPVIAKADRHGAQRHKQQRQHVIPRAQRRAENHKGRHAAQRDDEAAHDGGSLLLLMGLGAQLVNSLAQLQFAQPGDELRAGQQHDGCGENQGKNHP